VKIGVATHHDLAKYRRHVILLNFILGAVLTTPEVLTQVAMAIPLCLLYEACIWIAWYWDWKQRHGEAAAARLRLRALLVTLLLVAAAAWVRWDATHHSDAAGRPAYFWQRLNPPASPPTPPSAPPTP
jgi:hypothetical protein